MEGYHLKPVTTVSMQIEPDNFSALLNMLNLLVLQAVLHSNELLPLSSYPFPLSFLQQSTESNLHKVF